MRKNRFLTLWILVLGISMTSVLAVAAETPVEIERVKDLYYFKIQGKPSTSQGGDPPTDGRAEFTYKNLSPDDQSINIIIEVWFGYDNNGDPIQKANAEFPYPQLPPGDEWSSYQIENMDAIVKFWVYIEGEQGYELVFTDQIWIPHP